MSRSRDIADLGGVTTRLDQVGNSDGALSNRNMIINGDMQVAQRGTSFTSAGTQYTLDHFKTEQGGIDNALINVTQDSDAPSGFAKSLKVTVATAETAVADNEYMGLVHIIEAQDLQQLDYNTAAAKSVTLSFWVKASVTGVYAVANYTADGTRIIGATYTINSANTWEYKTVTYAGDTAGQLDDNNGAGFYLYWYFAAGPDRKSSSNTSWGAYTGTKLAYGQAVQLIETVNATWQITGVQLEVGDTSTDFEHISYGDQLQRCQRFYYCFEKADSGGHNGFLAVSYNPNSAYLPMQFPVEMRATPTFRMGGLWATRLGNNNAFTASANTHNSSKIGGVFYTPVSSVPGSSAFWVEPSSGDTSNTAYLNFDAEL